MRPSQRAADELRLVTLERNVARYAEGSCLVKFGNTHVLCTASLEDKPPPWLRGQGRGWVTAEYAMLPRATSTRTRRESTAGRPSGRTQEIQRLIGRSLRAVVNLPLMGERQVTVDCDVLQADGGTRTAAITGAWVALHDCLAWMRHRSMLKEMPLRDHVAAVSCGMVKGEAVLDLDYAEDFDRRDRRQLRDHRQWRPRRGAGDGRSRALHPGSAGRHAGPGACRHRPPGAAAKGSHQGEPLRHSGQSACAFAQSRQKSLPLAGSVEVRRQSIQDRAAAMKVTLERAALLKALGHIHRVVERRTTIPILSNVLVRATERSLQLKATDLDIEVTEEVAADVAQPGATTLPAHVLHDIVRKLPDGAQVTLDMSGEASQLVLRSGRSRFQLQCLPESDFPDLTTGDLPHRFVLPAGQLKQLIEKTQFAISTEETRYYLNGIYLHAMEVEGTPVLRVVSTDGHRLARVEMPAPEGSADMPGVIVPRKAVSEIQKLIEDPAATVSDRTLGHQDPLHLRRGGADLQADRRHLPGLRARHPGRQRQDAAGREACLRGRGGPRRRPSRPSAAAP